MDPLGKRPREEGTAGGGAPGGGAAGGGNTGAVNTRGGAAGGGATGGVTAGGWIRERRDPREEGTAGGGAPGGGAAGGGNTGAVNTRGGAAGGGATGGVTAGGWIRERRDPRAKGSAGGVTAGGGAAGGEARAPRPGHLSSTRAGGCAGPHPERPQAAPGRSFLRARPGPRGQGLCPSGAGPPGPCCRRSGPGPAGSPVPGTPRGAARAPRAERGAAPHSRLPASTRTAALRDTAPTEGPALSAHGPLCPPDPGSGAQSPQVRATGAATVPTPVPCCRGSRTEDAHPAHEITSPAPTSNSLIFISTPRIPRDVDATPGTGADGLDGALAPGAGRLPPALPAAHLVLLEESLSSAAPSPSMRWLP
nr:transmembrane protein 18 isoform X2 [Equus caballus]